MRQVYAVLVLGLVLVFALGSVATAGILRYEDYERPDHNLLGDGEVDDDHPWGGDRMSGETGDGGGTVITITNYLYVDMWLVELYRLFLSDKPVPATEPELEAQPETLRSYRAARPSAITSVRPRIGGGKVVAR